MFFFTFTPFAYPDSSFFPPLPPPPSSPSKTTCAGWLGIPPRKRTLCSGSWLNVVSCVPPSTPVFSKPHSPTIHTHTHTKTARSLAHCLNSVANFAARECALYVLCIRQISAPLEWTDGSGIRSPGRSTVLTYREDR